ncbi:hypothetical protein OAO87_00285 [bacterium]|nr:hypothetical protein [bacterium]
MTSALMASAQHDRPELTSAVRRRGEQRLQAQGKLTEFQAAELKEHFSGVRGLGAKQVSLSCDGCLDVISALIAQANILTWHRPPLLCAQVGYHLTPLPMPYFHFVLIGVHLYLLVMEWIAAHRCVTHYQVVGNSEPAAQGQPPYHDPGGLQ